MKTKYQLLYNNTLPYGTEVTYFIEFNTLNDAKKAAATRTNAIIQCVNIITKYKVKTKLQVGLVKIED